MLLSGDRPEGLGISTRGKVSWLGGAGAQEARQALAAAGALCATLRRTAADAGEWAAGIDAELPGLLTTGEA